MSAFRPSSSTWVADGTIGLTTGETLVGTWITTWGMWGGPLMADPYPPDQTSVLRRDIQGIQLRLGLLWTTSPDTAEDPISTLADPLWVGCALWDMTVVTPATPNPLNNEVTEAQAWGLATHRLPQAKVEGQRRAEGPRWLKFTGSEAGGPPSWTTWHSHMGMHALVSALVMLPAE